MNNFHPQQLSLDFESNDQLEHISLLPFVDNAAVLSEHRLTARSESFPVVEAGAVVSLCDFREAGEIKKVSKIYRSILDSVLHIA